jgi:EmrB/QacA subfamily drug resistance transporter
MSISSDSARAVGVPASPAQLAVKSPSGRWVLVAAILGSALAGIDGTVVGIALPRIGESLHADFAGLQWTVTGYTLTLASLILLGGAAGDRFGRRRVFLIGTIWFTSASVLCVGAPTIQFLVASRVLQGVGGALLTPASLAILEGVFRPEDRPAAVGTWAGFSGVAGALAPFVGGWLIALGSWRLVFVINVPLAAVVVLVTLRHMPESLDEGARTQKLDWVGAALTVGVLAGLTFALIGSRGRAGVAVPMLGVVVAGAAALVFYRRERNSRTPLLPLDLFRVRQFTAANAVTFVVYGAIGVFFFLLVLQLQVVDGWSPLAAGSATIPVTLLTLCLSRRSGRIAQRIGPRIQMTVGPLLCAGAVLMISHIDKGARYAADVLPAVALFGLGLATMVAPLTSAALGSVSASHAGIASGFNNAVARTGSLIAIAAVPGLSGITGDAASDPARFGDGFRTSMVTCAALFVAGAAMACAWVRRPSHVS